MFYSTHSSNFIDIGNYLSIGVTNKVCISNYEESHLELELFQTDEIEGDLTNFNQTPIAKHKEQVKLNLLNRHDVAYISQRAKDVICSLLVLF